jgi:AraC-like DNA-binding protein
MDVVASASSIDALGDALHALRFRSSVLCRSHLRAPWGFTVRGGDVATFHLLLEGKSVLETTDETVALGPGDLVVLPRGGTHTLRDTPGSPAIGLDDLLAKHPPDAEGRLRYGGRGARTLLLCGAFTFDGRAALPILDALPSTMHVRARDPHATWLRFVVDTLALEIERSRPGGGALVDRLMDILFIQAVRSHIGALASADAGLIGALRDPHISAAIGAIHKEPERAWTVGRLATKAGLSRTVFATRFAMLLAESPMRYLARFRMVRAIELLRDSALTVPLVAERVGYESAVAFSKAFKRHVGVGPGTFRRRPPS